MSGREVAEEDLGREGVGQHQPKKVGEEFELDVRKRALNSRAGWCFMQTQSEKGERYN